MSDLGPMPLDYHERRRWQDAHAAAGLAVPCGREACCREGGTVGRRPWANEHTPLLYCQRCAGLINYHNPGFCSPMDPSNV